MNDRAARRALVLFLLVGCNDSGSPTSPNAPPPTTTTSVPANANLAGNYTFTVTASSVCTTLPANVRTRTYSANLTQNGINIAGNLTSSSIQSQAIVGTVNGNSVTLGISFGEFVTSSSFLAVGLQAQGTVAGGTISGTATGPYTFSSASGNLTCNAADHRFTFTRQ